MAHDRVFGVLLTQQAWSDLAEWLAPYSSEGRIEKYIYCQKVHPDGQYFVMVATCENPDGSSFEAEISIPHHYVKLCIAAPKKSQIGFVQE
jgi:hypothetical protein